MALEKPTLSHSTQLFRLVYYSEVNFDVAGLPETKEVAEILSWSRSYNPSVGVTGALMLGSGRFAQVLEGPFQVLRPLFGNIALDQRHKFVRILQCEAMEERYFGDWSMAFIDEEQQRRVVLSERPAGSDLAAPSVSAKGVIALLRWLLRQR